MKLRDNTEFALDLEKLAGEASLKGIFVKKMLERMNSADDTQKAALKKALNLGLKAFLGEVKYNED